MKRSILLFLIIILVGLLAACRSTDPAPESLRAEDKVATIVAGTLSAMPSATFLPTSTAIPNPMSPEPISDINWISVHDPILKITVLYPENWILSSAGNGFIRLDASEGDKTHIPYTIQISQYHLPITSEESLLTWTEQYDQISGFYDDPKNKISVRESLEINGLDTVYTLLDFPEARYTNIRREDVVLFVWSNIGKSADEIYANIYQQIIMSFASK